jgi:hypothetical protein
VSGMYSSLKSLLAKFDGIEEVSIEEAEPGEAGILPAAVSLRFSPSNVGFHALEFLVWAIGDMRRGGANIRDYLRSPPPWLNEPGRSLVLDVYIYQRSKDASESKALEETTREIGQMTEFLSFAYKEHWSECCPTN